LEGKGKIKSRRSICVLDLGTRQPRSFRPIYDFEKEELQVKTGSLNERLKNVGNVFFGHKKGRLSPKG
jgi:hypothetical protein